MREKRHGFYGLPFTSIIGISGRLGRNRFTLIRTAHVRTQHDATHKTHGKHFYPVDCVLPFFFAEDRCPWYWGRLLCLACIFTAVSSLYGVSKLCSDTLIVFRTHIMGTNLISPGIVNLVYGFLFLLMTPPRYKPGTILFPFWWPCNSPDLYFKKPTFCTKIHLKHSLIKIKLISTPTCFGHIRPSSGRCHA